MEETEFLERKKRRTRLSIALLILFHTVGAIGLSLDATRELVLGFTPMNLVLSCMVLMWNHKKWNIAFVFWLLGVMLTGYLVEVVGVQGKCLFGGGYHYGETLGWELWEVPPVMGINWFILVYSVGIIFLNWRMNIIVKSLLGASLMVGLDIFIEPVAIALDFWNWESIHVPFQNYITWGVISFVMLLIFFVLPDIKSNKVGPALFFIQLAFFVVLNLTL